MVESSSGVWHGSWSTVYWGDCFEILPAIPRRSVGLLCFDPPYGINYISGNRQVMPGFGKIPGDDGEFDLELLGKLATSRLMVNRHIYVFGFRPEQIPASFCFGGSCEIIWDKGQVGMGNLSLPYGPQHEPISFGVYTPGRSNRAEGYGNLSARMRKGSVLQVPRINASRATKHPTEKPVRLIQHLIESSSVPGDTILDPCVGVGSTIVAATLLGRKSIGIELDREYAREAVRRAKKAERIRKQMESL